MQPITYASDTFKRLQNIFNHHPLSNISPKSLNKIYIAAMTLILGGVVYIAYRSLVERVSRAETQKPSKSIDSHRLAQNIKARAAECAEGGLESPIDLIVSSESFLKNPTDDLIRSMVIRGVEGARTDDLARAFVIGLIPDFIDNVSSIDYLGCK